MPSERNRGWFTSSGLRCRGTDRVEDAVAWLLIALGILVVVLALAVGIGAYGEGVQRAQDEGVQRSQIDAVLLRDAPAIYTDSGWAVTERVPARYTDPTGREHVGDVPVRGAHAAGATVRVWVDREGRLTSEPLSPAGAVVAAVVDAAGVLMLGGLVLAVAWAGVRHAVDARNAGLWEQEWEQVEPEWSGRK